MSDLFDFNDNGELDAFDLYVATEIIDSDDDDSSDSDDDDDDDSF